MKELDILMLGYLENQYDGASPAAQQAFEVLLDVPDPDLFALITGKASAEDPDVRGVVEAIRNATRC